MKNLRKRTYISRDISFFKNHKTPKKLKVNGLEYENQSSINSQEVKIILDATVVEKYLENRKSVHEVLITTPMSNNLSSPTEKNSVPHVVPTQTNKKANNVFSTRNNVMVKLEVPEDLRVDNSISKENYDFLNVSVKQEDHILVQDINEFKEPITDDDFQFQNNNNDSQVCLTTEVAETEFKNETIDSSIWSEEMTIGPEFKHEEIISQNNETAELVTEKNNAVIEETPVPTIRRSSRKRKKVCHNCDDCDHKEVKKSQTPSNVNEKHTSKASDQNSHGTSKPRAINRTQNSNCNSQSRTSFRTNRPKTNLASPQSNSDVKQLFNCDHCDYQTSRKQNIVGHVNFRHLLLFSKYWSCEYCKLRFRSANRLEAHKLRCTPELLLKCKFCSDSVSSKAAMRQHLIEKHENEFHNKSKRNVIAEAWWESVQDVIAALELEGNTNKLAYFRLKCFRDKHYHRDKDIDFSQLYCKKCDKRYERIYGQRKKCCPDCKTELLYQCQKCKMTTAYYQSIWRHWRGKCCASNNSNNLPSVTDEERLTKSQDEENDVAKTDSSCGKRSFKCSKCGNHFSGKWRFKRHAELCGISIRYPCKFCPTTYFTTMQLSNHLYSAHVHKLDGIDMEEVIEEISNFRTTIKAFNTEKVEEKYSELMVADETTNNPSCYLEGIKSILNKVCCKCNATDSHPFRFCVECRSMLTFQCLRCDESFEEYSNAWEHITKTCKNRIFPLTIEESSEARVQSKKSVKARVPKLFHCDYCGFKIRNKAFLSRHIMSMHNMPTIAIQAHFPCFKCNEIYYTKEEFIYHLPKCRTYTIVYIYNCPLCPCTATSCDSMKQHMIKWHSYYFHRDEKGFDRSLRDIMLNIEKNRRINDESISQFTGTGKLREFTETGRPVRRKSSETVKLVRFRCPKCNVIFSQEKVPHVKDIKQCGLCQTRLALECKNCDKVYSNWCSMVSHFSRNLCPGVKPSTFTVSTHQLHHPYAETIHLDHSYAIRFGQPEAGNEGNS